MKFFRSLYINSFFFVVLGGLAAGFLLSYWLPMLYPLLWFAILVFISLVVLDVFMLFQKNGQYEGSRDVPQKLSNSDLNPISISLKSNYPFCTQVEIIDELPVQFQKRDFIETQRVLAYEEVVYNYEVRPVDRGVYTFGRLNIYVSSPLRLIKRRFHFNEDQSVPVYPSIIQMQQFDFLAANNRITDLGLKKIRRIGHTQEFEQIKEYIQGDDFRTINWKATAKKNQMMVNQYQDEKSQPIYNIIDTSRVMKMPFNELKLLDYAVNTALAFSNVSLKKNDKTGLITFSKTIEQFLPAVQRKSYLSTILESLYAVDTEFLDADYGMLYAQIKRKINQRSLLVLYTNFEHISGLKRQLPYLQAIAKKHVLVVVFFENTELDALIESPAKDLKGVYHKAIAEKMARDKRLMQKEMERHGILTILTAPKDLTIKTINKYLEIKSRGLL